MKPYLSPLQRARVAYQPGLPRILAGSPARVAVRFGKAASGGKDAEAILRLFPHTARLKPVAFTAGKPPASLCRPFRAAVVFSGGQAPGGHNVVAGLFDALKRLNRKNALFGFLGGPSGLVEGRRIEITARLLEAYRNTGGFHLIGSGRTKIEKPEQFEAVGRNLSAAGITALVVVGGDDSNTNAAMLAEYFLDKGSPVRVVGCPKTIDGDLKNDAVEVSFGFDTACRVYAELAGNVARDCLSAKKYWHFIRLMGRSASHIALEVALKVRPNLCLISEEAAAGKWTLEETVDRVARLVADRAAAGKNYGVVLVPEGLLEFLPDMKALITELNELLADGNASRELEGAADRASRVVERLGEKSRRAFQALPPSLQLQLLAERDPHGNVQVSKIETEKLLMEAVALRLHQWRKEGRYTGNFSAQGHFFGYEGRCADPSNFDADYCYSLGAVAAFLAAAGLTGYLASVRDLLKPAARWRAGGVPLAALLNLERRHGKDKPVIRKALVDLKGAPFRAFVRMRGHWALEDAYASPGPLQFWGPREVAYAVPETLRLERGG